MQTGSLALPHRPDLPSGAAQGKGRAPVTRDVRGELSTPKIQVLLDLRRAAAAPMPVPEAPMNEHDHSTFIDHKVRRARQGRNVRSKTNPSLAK